MTCWKCGKKGNFAGQVCDECFNKMERDYELEQEDEWAEKHYGSDADGYRIMRRGKTAGTLPNYDEIQEEW